MTMKGFNWMLLGAALFVGGCVVDAKDDSGDDGFDTISDSDADADADADADGDADGDSDADADADADGGDGVFDVQSGFVWPSGVFADGEVSGATYINTETGEVDDFESEMLFVFQDNDDVTATGGSDETYFCVVRYPLADVSVADDFADYDWQGYTGSSYMLDTGAGVATQEGNCDGAAFGLGVGDITEWIDAKPWGYGFGPITTEFEDELSGYMGSDWTDMGDTPGQFYLLAELGGSTETFSWGYFQVYGFGEGTLLDFDSGPVAGVRDSATASDGFYNVETVYSISWSAG